MRYNFAGRLIGYLDLHSLANPEPRLMEARHIKGRDRFVSLKQHSTYMVAKSLPNL